MRRYGILVAAFAMQLCLGATYSWSVFVRPLRDLTGLSQGMTQLPFTVFYLAFPATATLSGFFLSRFGPRVCALAGGAVFGTGWLVASLGGDSFALTVAGIGVLAGMGVGVTYVVPIAILVQWFPRHKGLATGVGVAGFGGGAALVGRFAGWLLTAGGQTPFEVFRIAGTTFIIVVACAGWFMAFPPGYTRAQVVRWPLVATITSRQFSVLYVAMIAGLAAGFTVNANLKELVSHASMDLGVAAVTVFALANAAGRIAWGEVFDRSPGVNALAANLGIQAFILLMAPLLLQSREGLMVVACVVGLNYGGVLVLYASMVSRVWGRSAVGPVYGWLFSANVIAAPLPLIIGLSYDVSGSFSVGLLALGLSLAGACWWIVRRRGIFPPEEPAPASALPETAGALIDRKDDV